MLNRLKTLKLAILLTPTLFAGVFFATPVQAGHDGGTPYCSHPNSILGISSWDRWLHCSPDDNSAVVEFEFPGDIWLVVLAVVEILTRLAVYLAVGLIIYAGFKFIIAQGNPEKIQEAKTIIEQALVGLAISVLATVIVVFIGNSVI